MFGMRVIGLAGWSGARKSTLLARVIPVFVGRGLTVATLKHAHHVFDTGRPRRDSYEHRRAGASGVLVSSGRRWALVHELDNEPEATLAELLWLVSPCNLVGGGASSAGPSRKSRFSAMRTGGPLFRRSADCRRDQ